MFLCSSCVPLFMQDPEELPDATDLTRQDSATRFVCYDITRVLAFWRMMCVTSWGAADFGDDEDGKTLGAS